LEPFFTTKPIGKGTGLGLSQIFGFVRQSQGEITIRSAPGEGTTVTLYLPRHRTSVEDTPAEPAPAPSPDTAARTALDILVIEDDPRVLAATLSALEALGHRPTGCADPHRALDMVRNAPRLDLVISDVLMPGKTGPEVIAEIHPLFPDLPVMFVTGFAGEAGAADFGGHTVLRKPYTLPALQAAIDAATASDTRQPVLAE
jgi:CheY-like chemotaxis protein